MHLSLPRLLFTLVFASLAKPSVAEKRKKPRQLSESFVTSKDKDDKRRLLLSQLAARWEKANESRRHETAVDKTEALLTNAERKAHPIVGVVNTEKDSANDVGIFANSERNVKVSDDIPFGLQQGDSGRVLAPAPVPGICFEDGVDCLDPEYVCDCECAPSKPTPSQPTPIPTELTTATLAPTTPQGL